MSNAAAGGSAHSPTIVSQSNPNSVRPCKATGVAHNALVITEENK